MAHTIIGTAGHIDHGKTLLVHALTGTQTDKTPQERSRGITIELGFAFFGDKATIIDVPGHERFVKTMVAGVSTIDLALLVIAADDGVMPQSREHVDILKILGITRGIIVLNKVDLAEEEWLELVEEDIRELVKDSPLENASILRVSALAGTGIEELKELLNQMITATTNKTQQGPFRLPVDRTFLVKGFGLVNTGTVLAGSLKEGDNIEVQPSGRSLRVRGMQTHGHTVPAITAGDRAALNLPGIEVDDINRGDVLCSPDYFKPSHMLDAQLDLLSSSPKPILHRTRIRLHLGTCEVLARVHLMDRDVLEPGDSTLVQFRLETPTIAVWGDRYVIRRYSPQLTIGGGHILDPHPVKHKRSNKGYIEQLAQLNKHQVIDVIGTKLLSGQTGMKDTLTLAGELGLSLKRTESELRSLATSGQVVLVKHDNRLSAVHQTLWDEYCQRITTSLSAYHSQFPLKLGPNREELKNKSVRILEPVLYNALLAYLEKAEQIIMDGAAVRTANHSIQFSADEKSIRDQIEATLKEADFANMPDSNALATLLKTDQKQINAMLKALQDLALVIVLEGGLVLHINTVEKVKNKLRQALQQNGQIKVAEFRDLIGSNRRYALALLSYFDAVGFTQRREDVRISIE